MSYFITILLAMMTLFIDNVMTEWTSVGKPYTLQCEYEIDSFSSFTWRSQDGNSLYICFEHPIRKCDASSDSFKSLYEANITLSGSVYKSFFTIKSVPILPYNTNWFCQITFTDQMSTKTENFTLSVFAPPVNPTCDTVELVDDINVLIHCYTDAVYPPGICSFYIKTNESTIENMMYNGSVSYVSVPSSITGYYKTECTVNVTIYRLGKGKHSFSVEMFADIPVNIIEEMKSVGQHNGAITIGYPQAELGSDCYVDIKLNENRTCTCYDLTNSILTPIITWITGNEIIEKSATLNMDITLLEGKTITCLITNVLNWTNRIDYFVRRSYNDLLPRIYTLMNGEKYIGSNNILSLPKGENVVMCEHEGSLKVYDKMSFRCDFVESFSQRKAETEVSILVLNTSKMEDNATCTCKVWGDETNSPQRVLTVFIKVFQDTSISDNELKNWTIGLGVTSGFLVLITIATLTVVIIWRVKNKKRKHSNNEQKIDRGDYADIRENPHKYDMPVFKTNNSVQDDTITTVDRVNIDKNVTVLHTSSSGLITTENMRKNKHVYSNELLQETIPNEEYHQYDEAVMSSQ